MFATLEELNKINSGNLETFNEVLLRVHNNSVEEAIKATPEIAMKLVDITSGLAKVVKDFSDANPDFAGNDTIVKKCIQEVEAENPEKSYKDILAIATPKIKQEIKNISAQLDIPNEQLTLNGMGVITLED